MSTENAPIEEDLPEQLRIRREKRASLLEGGTQPYPVSVPRTKTLKEVREKYSALEIDVATGDIESLTGRIIFKRDTGKLCFATLREGDGTELQAMFSLDKIGQESIDSWKSDIDLGDIVSSPTLTRVLEKILAPVLGKSFIVYSKKPSSTA